MRRVSAREAHDLMREGYVYLDVRSVPEFDAGHPSGAYNVPWLDNPRFVVEVGTLFALDQRIVVGCASGVRSLAAAQQLEAQGFQAIVEQRAGMAGVRDPFGRVQEPGWQAHGLPVSIEAEPGRGHRQIAERAAQTP